MSLKTDVVLSGPITEYIHHSLPFTDVADAALEAHAEETGRSFATREEALLSYWVRPNRDWDDLSVEMIDYDMEESYEAWPIPVEDHYAAAVAIGRVTAKVALVVNDNFGEASLEGKTSLVPVSPTGIDRDKERDESDSMRLVRAYVACGFLPPVALVARAAPDEKSHGDMAGPMRESLAFVLDLVKD